VRGDDDAGVDATVALDAGHALRGTIRDADGAPAAGVAVVLAPCVDFVNDAVCARTTTGADGAFLFDGVESGRYALWYAVRDDVVVDAAVLLVPGADAIDVRMTRGASIEGAVLDADSGAPVAGARVVAVRYRGSGISGVEGLTDVLDAAPTDRLGRFALRTWRPTCKVTAFFVDAAGYAPTPIDAVLPSGSIADGQRLAVDLRVRREAAVHGTVTGPDGPLAGFVVAARPEDEGVAPYPRGPDRAVVTGADGTFRISGLPAGKTTLIVAVADRGGILSETDVELEAVRDVAHDLRVEIRRVHLKRHVLDASDAPIADAEATQRLGPWGSRGVSNALGVVEMDFVFAGEAPARVTVRAKGFHPMETFVDSGEGEAAFPQLHRGDEFAGKLARGDETGVPGVRLVVHGGVVGVEGQTFWNWDATRETVTGVDGSFRLPIVGGPQHFVAARNVEGVQSQGGFDEDIGVESLEMRLAQNVRVAGRVVGAGTDDPVAGATIVLFETTVVGRTGADGRFAVDVPATDAGGLAVVAPGRLVEPVVGEGPDCRVELRRSFAVVGIVRTPGGTPATGLQVRLRPHGAADDASHAALTSATDADGRFVVPGVAAGDVEINVFDPTHHAVAGPRVTTTAGGAELALVVRPAAPLVVQVVDGAGEPLRRADVTARADAADLAGDVGETDDEGRVTLGLAPDATYTVRVEGYRIEPGEQKGVRAGAETLVVVVKSDRLPRGR
jgi:5-hydroxyisourate hydrolase-like protein (transthyretin family)